MASAYLSLPIYIDDAALPFEMYVHGGSIDTITTTDYYYYYYYYYYNRSLQL